MTGIKTVAVTQCCVREGLLLVETAYPLVEIAAVNLTFGPMVPMSGVGRAI